jgi:Na+-translocating ferredoxin:NAD+ oxidoreductase subunit G
MPGEGWRMLGTGAVLACVALLGSAVLSGAQRHSAPYIAANQRQALLDSLQVVVPPGSFDNDILDDFTDISDPGRLGSPDATRVYRASLAGEPRAAAFRVVAPDGYSGPIDLLLGVTVDGRVAGVRVVSHRETPGLGDAIEARRSDWILGFDGRSLEDPGEAGWRVVRDGGVFDQFTGATVTPRAVVSAVRSGLEFAAVHREQLFGADSESSPAAADTRPGEP